MLQIARKLKHLARHPTVNEGIQPKPLITTGLKNKKCSSNEKNLIQSMKIMIPPSPS